MEKENPKTENPKKFIHFGCWNKGHCSGNPSADKDPINGVFSSMNNYIANNKEVEFVIVAGDNYYPDKEKKVEKLEGKEKSKEKGEKSEKGEKGEKSKEKKTKKINEDNLISGLKCLSNLKKETYLLWGNHDVELLDECKIITTQQEYYKSHNKIHVFDFESDLFNVVDTTLFIYLDTTIYDDKNEDPDYACYKHLLPKDTPTTDITKNLLQNLQKERVERILNKVLHHTKTTTKTTTTKRKRNAIENIVCVGHHPIVCFKNKKESVQLLSMPSLMNFIYGTIYSKGSDIKYYYLCADLHQYQPGVIKINDEMTINQYISGTGGADLDDEVSVGEENKAEIFFMDDKKTKIPAEYTMTESKSEHGFLTGTIKVDGNIDFDFHSTSTPTPTSTEKKGGRVAEKTRKTRKTRQSKKTRKSKRKN